MKKYNIAILGATGAVGQEFLTLIEERKFPFANLSVKTDIVRIRALLADSSLVKTTHRSPSYMSVVTGWSNPSLSLYATTYP